MIQAAQVTPAPGGCHALCFLPRSLSFAPSGGVQPHRRRRLCSEGSEHRPLVSTSSASGVECPVGTPLHPWAPAITSTAADGGSVSRSACASALGSGRFAPCGGAAWPLAPRNRGLAPRDRGDRAPAEQPRGPLRAATSSLCCAECRHGRRSFAPPLERDSAAARRPFRQILRVAEAPCPTPRVLHSAPATLHSEREPPLTA